MSGPPATSAAQPDIDRAVPLIVIYSALCGVSLIIVVLRVWARLSLHTFGWDDTFMLVTWTTFAALTVIVGLFGAHGGGRHIYHLKMNEAVYVVRLIYIAQPFAIVSCGAGKISVALMILRFFRSALSPWSKRALWTLILLTGLFSVLSSIFTFTQCHVPAALWEPSLKATTYCWHPSVQSDISVFTGSWNVAMDFALALWPVPYIWRLHLTVRKRTGLVVLLGCGSFSGVAAIFKTEQLVSLAARSDLTWETFQLFIWAGVELAIIILCGSVPALRPLWGRVAQRGGHDAAHLGRRSQQYSSEVPYDKSSASEATPVRRGLSGFGGLVRITGFLTTARKTRGGGFAADASHVTHINPPQPAFHATHSV